MGLLAVIGAREANLFIPIIMHEIHVATRELCVEEVAVFEPRVPVASWLKLPFLPNPPLVSSHNPKHWKQ